MPRLSLSPPLRTRNCYAEARHKYYLALAGLREETPVSKPPPKIKIATKGALCDEITSSQTRTSLPNKRRLHQCEPVVADRDDPAFNPATDNRRNTPSRNRTARESSWQDRRSRTVAARRARMRRLNRGCFQTGRRRQETPDSTTAKRRPQHMLSYAIADEQNARPAATAAVPVLRDEC
jgi:hypothetical protein